MRNQKYSSFVALVTENHPRWHADIKPDNILNVGNRWKLADPGFSKFRIEDARTALTKADFGGGTITYGEC